MDLNQIKESVRVAVMSNLLCWNEEWDEDRSFASYGADSLDQVEIMFCVEEEFEIEFPDEECARIKTPAQLVDYLAAAMANQEV
ncbi:MAG: phosphopantetheine-binding protein [Kiritimatiellae bacterium]|nr:phosphopantetheine-binding protein [Kiritimatiellia bacterium]